MELFASKEKFIELDGLKKKVAAGLSFFDYLKLMTTGEYAPGLEAIEDKLSEKYPLSMPIYMSVPFNKRKKTPIEGFRIYQVEQEYYHIITLGMSELYPKETYFGRRYSKYGYEMTAKIKAESLDECLWLLEKMVDYGIKTKETECYFVEDELLYGYNKPLTENTKLTTIMLTQDDTLGKIDTVHGEVQFLQLVGLTEKDAQGIRNSVDSYTASQDFLNRQKNENPDRVMDIRKTKNYFVK